MSHINFLELLVFVLLVSMVLLFMFLKDEIKEIKERQKHFIDYSAHWDDINILIKEINKRIETKDKIKPIQNYDITPDEDLEK